METSKLVRTIYGLFPRSVRNFVAELLSYVTLSYKIEKLKQQYNTLEEKLE